MKKQAEYIKRIEIKAYGAGKTLLGIYARM